MKVRSRSLALAAAAGIVAGAVVAWVAPTLAERASTTKAVAPSQDRALPPPQSQGFVLHKIAPCRIVDTRAATGSNKGPLGPNVSRSYYVGGTFGFAPQGGKSGGCGIPTTASSIAVSISAVAPSGTGYLRAWPSDQSEPTATILNYTNGVAMTVGATQPVAVTSGKALTVKNAFGSAHLVVDVTGYYSDQTQAQVEPNGILLDSTRTFLSSSRLATGTYRITVDHDITACSIQAQSTVFSYYTSVGTISGSTFDIYVWRINSGVNTLTDGRFFVTVTC